MNTISNFLMLFYCSCIRHTEVSCWSTFQQIFMKHVLRAHSVPDTGLCDGRWGLFPRCFPVRDRGRVVRNGAGWSSCHFYCWCFCKFGELLRVVIHQCIHSNSTFPWATYLIIYIIFPEIFSECLIYYVLDAMWNQSITLNVSFNISSNRR